MSTPEKRVLVGMSGGIDSTATCLMLKEQGYEIVGLTMWVWGDEPVEARQLADSMGIEHHVADEREAFRQIIVQNFIDEYCQGRTPNPCVMCNPLFKFRILTEWVSKPEGTYMLFLDCTDWCKAHGKTIAEVEKAGWNVGVAWQDGRMFHGPCAIRMNLALPLTRVQEAFERLDKYVFNEEWV